MPPASLPPSEDEVSEPAAEPEKRGRGQGHGGEGQTGQGQTGQGQGGRRKGRTKAVMLLNMGGLGLALLGDALWARRLGATGVADALVVAWILPRLIANVARDATKFSLVTEFVRAGKTEANADINAMSPDARLACGLFNLSLVLSGLIALVMAVAAQMLVRVTGPGLDATDRALAATLLVGAIPIAACGVLSAVPEAWLNAHRAHRWATGRGWCLALGTLGGIGWSMTQDALPSAAMRIAIGVGLGWVASWAWLMVGAMRIGWRPSMTTWLSRGELSALKGAVGYPLAGFGMRQGARAALQAIVSLGPAGSVAAFYFALRLIGAVQNILGVSLAVTGQPKLTATDASGDRAGFRRAMVRRAKASILLSLPVMVLVIVFNGFIARFVFGEATGRDADTILAVLAVSLPTACLIPVLNAAVYARQRYGGVLLNMTMASCITVLGGWALFHFWGVAGVASGVVIGSVASAVNLWRQALPREGGAASTLDLNDTQPGGRP